jgi:hypothetical protein
MAFSELAVCQKKLTGDSLNAQVKFKATQILKPFFYCPALETSEI